MIPFSKIKRALSSFQNMCAIVDEHEPDEIIRSVAVTFKIPPDALANAPMGGYAKGNTSGAYRIVLEDLKKNMRHYKWVYEHLADDISRYVFSCQIAYRIVPDINHIKRAYDAAKYPQYFDADIVTVSDDEVFVDCGGYTGDTALSYIKNCKTYKKIYVYEPSAENMAKCRENLGIYENICLREAGVGSKNQLLPFSSNDSSGKFSEKAGAEGGDVAGGTQIISLDEDIKEPVTFIKMDIETFEVQGILGAKEHIRKDSPKLAICVYHIVSDI